MTDELQAEVVPPKPRRVRKLAVRVGCGLAGAAAGVLATTLWMRPAVRTQPVVIQLPTPVCDSPPPPPVIVPAPMPTVPPPEPARDVALVITIGEGTYVELDAPMDLPRHAAPTLVRDLETVTAIAEVATRDVPDDLRKRTVSVDGSCKAHVTGYVLIGRLKGAARDAEENLDEWTAAKVIEYGRPTLFARLDGCPGMIARDASLPAITVLEDGDDPGNLASRALDRFKIADPVIRAQKEWLDAGNEGAWYEAVDARVETRVMRHPRTGVTWVLVHAYLDNECGQLGGNALGLYRVEEGKLVTDLERDGDMPRIEQVVDLEGDGALELVGSSPDYMAIQRANGDDVRSLGVATYGCGC